MAGTSTFYTSGTTTTTVEVRQTRLGEAKPHGFGLRRRLAHRKTSRETSLFLEQLRQSFSLKHSTVLTTQQPLRFLGKRICRHPNGDITISLESSIWKGLTTTCSSRWTSTTTSILFQHHLCGDLQHIKTHHLVQIDITSTAKLLGCSSGHHWYVQTSNSQPRITHNILHHHQSGIGVTSRYITFTLKFLDYLDLGTLTTTSTSHPVAHQHLL